MLGNTMSWMGDFRRAAVVLGLAAGLWGRPVSADGLTYSFSDANRSASAHFEQVGSDLMIVLTNTSTHDALVPVDVLTALFFDLAGEPTLTPGTVILASGAVVRNGSSNGGDMSSEFAFKAALAGAPGEAAYGVSTVGLGLFGPHDRFDTTVNLHGPASPAGLEYGMVSAHDNPATGNSPLQTNPLIQDAVVVRLQNLPAGYDLLTGLSNVWFQYGTDLSEPRFAGSRPLTPGGFSEPTGAPVPEPASAALAALGLLALLAPTRRRTR